MITHFVVTLFGSVLLSAAEPKIQSETVLKTYSVTGYSFETKKVSDYETKEVCTKYKLSVKTYIPKDNIEPISEVIRYQEFGSTTHYTGRWFVTNSKYYSKHTHQADINGKIIYFSL